MFSELFGLLDDGVLVVQDPIPGVEIGEAWVPLGLAGEESNHPYPHSLHFENRCRLLPVQEIGFAVL